VTAFLDGLRVLVTRPVHQADKLSQLVENAGGVPVRFPVLAIIGIENNFQATNPLVNLSRYQWLIFTSANAVNFAVKAIGGKIQEFIGNSSGFKIASIGKATADALNKFGLTPDLMPNHGFDSENLLLMPEFQTVDGISILIVRGLGGREELATILRERGAFVDYWEVYQRVLPNSDKTEVHELLSSNKLDCITITSTEALQNLLVMIDDKNYQKTLFNLPLVVISNRIRKLAEEIGFKQIKVTENPSDQAILDTIMAMKTEEYCG
jgi:uroporphyrinogen-III synthase